MVKIHNVLKLKNSSELHKEVGVEFSILVSGFFRNHSTRYEPYLVTYWKSHYFYKAV